MEKYITRYNDPKIARFLTEDTYIGNPNDPLSLNLYTYCNNEPIMYADPTGHAPVKHARTSDDTKDKIKYLKSAFKKVVDSVRKSVKSAKIKPAKKDNKSDKKEKTINTQGKKATQKVTQGTGKTVGSQQITPKDLLTMNPVKALLPVAVGSISVAGTSGKTPAQAKLEKAMISAGATYIVLEKIDTIKEATAQKLKDVFFSENKEKDSRLYGEPGDVNTEGNTETKIGPNGRAETERHKTTHGNPKIHSNPHDHDITWDEDGKPHFGRPRNYWDDAPPPLK